MEMDEGATISIQFDTQKRLEVLRNNNEDYDGIIVKLIDNLDEELSFRDIVRCSCRWTNIHILNSTKDKLINLKQDDEDCDVILRALLNAQRK